MKLRQRFTTHFTILLLSTSLFGQLTFGATSTSEEVALLNSNTQTESTVLDYKNLNVEGLLLPRNFFILENTYTTPDICTIFYKNALLSNSPSPYLSAVSSYGTVSEERWHFRTDAQTTYMNSKRFDLDFYLTDNTTFMQQNVGVELVDTSNTTPVRLLPIGDSLTRAGVYLNQVEKKLPNVKVVGTRIYNTDGMPAREGRGGWTLDRYFTAINSSELDKIGRAHV